MHGRVLNRIPIFLEGPGTYLEIMPGTVIELQNIAERLSGRVAVNKGVFVSFSVSVKDVKPLSEEWEFKGVKHTRNPSCCSSVGRCQGCGGRLHQSYSDGETWHQCEDCEVDK